MLEKIRVEIFVKSVVKFYVRFLPDYFIRKRNFGIMFKLHTALGREVDIDDLFSIVPNFKLFVSPNVHTFSVDISNDSPNGQIVNVHLVPVMVFDGIHEWFEFSFIKVYLAIFSFCHITCKINNMITFITPVYFFSTLLEQTWQITIIGTRCRFHDKWTK